MKNYIKIGFLAVLPSLLMAQGGIRNQGAVIEVSSDAQVNIVHGGMLHQGKGIIRNHGEIQLTKDWIQQGENSQYLGNGALSFIGHQNQQITSNAPLTIASLNINNGHRLILNNDLQIQRQLDLKYNGSVELGDNNILMKQQATIEHYDEQHYIITNRTGFLQQEVGEQTVVFPIGNATYNPASLNNQGVYDKFQMKVTDHTTEFEGAVDRTWLIEEGTQGGSLVNLKLQWNEVQELANFERNQSAIHTIYSTLPMDYAPANSDGNLWSQTSSHLTNLTSFTILSQKTTSLPPTRLDDGQPLIENIQLFPNPVQDQLNIRLEGKTGIVFIQVFDAKGSLVLQQNETIGNQYIVQLNGLQHLVEGIYSIQVTNEGQTTTHKFVKGQQ